MEAIDGGALDLIEPDSCSAGGTGTSAADSLASARVEALQTYGIFDSDDAEAFVEIAQLAADALEAPIALVSFVDDRREWISAGIGTDIAEVPMAVSLCAHAVRKADIYVLADATLDPRFRGNPLVAGHGCRFYAAVPLLTPAGVAIGTLCVLDIKARFEGIDARKARMLRALAAQVMAQLEHGRALERLNHALRESEERYRLTIKLGPLIAWTADPEGKTTDILESWSRLTGLTEAETRSGGWKRALHPDEAAAVVGQWEKSVCTGESFDMEYRIRISDGSYRWFHSRAVALRDESGHVACWYGTLEDIHERRESRNLLQTVIDSISDLIFVKDRDGDYILANRAMTDALGPVRGGRDEDFFPADQAAKFRQADLEVIATCERFEADEVVDIGGEMRTVETVKVPWRSGGQIAGIVGVSRDITARRRAEQALRESEEHYRYTVELSAQVQWTATADGAIEMVSPRWQELTGQSIEAALGNGWIASLHPSDVAPTLAAWKVAVRTGKPFDTKYRAQKVDGSYRWVHAHAAARRNESGEIVRWYGTLEDIHDRKLAEQALRESEERFRLAAQAAGLGIWDHDAISDTRIWSDELKSMLGLPLDATGDLPLAQALVHPEDRHILGNLVHAAASGDLSQKFEATLRIIRANDGALRWVRTGGWMTKAESGRLARLIVTTRDVTEERTAEDRVRWSATHDSLTRLPNRAFFQEELEQVIETAARQQQKAALLLMDIDHFKQINDSLGHDAGDALLCTFGERLRATIRNNEMVFRLGGDEFAVILSNIRDEADVVAVVERMQARLREPFIHNGHVLDCRVSIGASVFPDDAISPDELLKDADIALYAAKAAGRSQLMVFKPEMRAEMQRRASALNVAREALDHGRIIPFYQPKVDLSTGRIKGFEALLRWRHPRLGIQSPGSIAAAFDDLELASEISDRIFDRVISDMQRWLDTGVDFGHVAVNASAAEFRRDNLGERILERLDAASVPTSRLELEVTESVFLGRGAEYVDRALKLLASEKVSIALDDFGTGYASLSHLKQFPVHVIKIDRSFVRDIENDADDAAIIKAVLNLGQSLGIKIVAEGIENPVQAAFLAGQGCDYGQGFLFGRPLPAGRIANLLRNWNPARRWRRSYP